MEEGYRRAMLDQHNNLFGFFFQLVKNPLTLVLVLTIVVMVGGQTQFWAKMRGKILRARS